MNSLYKYTLIFIYLCASVSIFAQQKVEISGTVFDKATGKPLPYVTVSIGHNGATSDEMGNYQLQNVSRDLTNLRVSRVGYQSIEQKVDLTQSARYNFYFYLMETDNELSEVVVTGTRTEKTLDNTPILTKVVTARDIEQIGGVTAFDALQSLMPGIQFSPDGHGANMTIQGLDNDYILVLLNGERMVGETRGNVNLDRIAANDIKRVEIVSGASSVLYGSNAIGGVINIITKDVEKPFEGRLTTRYSNFNTWNTNLNLGMKRNRLSVKVNGFRNSSDGYDLTPDTPESFTASPYTDYSIGAKIGYKANDKLGISAHGNFFRHETFNPKASLDPTHQLKNNITAGGKIIYEFNDKHSLTFEVNTDKYKSYKVYEKLNDSTAKTAEYQYSALRLIDRYALSKKIDLMGGAEFNFENIFSQILFGVETDDSEKRKRAHDTNLFAQLDWKPIENAELIAGVRYTRHSAFGNHFTPNMSAMYKINRFKFRATAALGYKSPSLKELYYNFDHFGMFWIFGNKDLKPENARYFSLSGEYTRNTFNISINAYHNIIENKIDMRNQRNKDKDRSEFHFYNIGKARLRGVETYLNWQFLTHFKLKSGYAFTDARDESTGLQIYGNSKHTATTALTFFTRHTRFPLALTVSGRVASPRLYQVSRANKEGKQEIKKEKSKAFSVWRLTYMQQFPIWKQIKGTAQLGVDNIFNYSEIEKSAEINPGRTFWAALSIKF